MKGGLGGRTSRSISRSGDDPSRSSLERDLVPCAHTSLQPVMQFGASMRELRWTNPILLGPNDHIIAGHARLLVARQLNMSEVRVILLGVSDPTLVVADNQLALSLANWQEEILRVEVRALQDKNSKRSLLGLDEKQLPRLLTDRGAGEGLTDQGAEG
jgi:ParB-like chromosome segregation protein Spo0J